MIFLTHKKTISCLLIVSMLHLLLSIFANTVMANPSMNHKSTPIQSIQQMAIDCEHQYQPTSHPMTNQCEDCEKTCIINCSASAQISLLTAVHLFLNTSSHDHFLSPTARKPISRIYKPTPRPPKPHHS